MRRPGKNVRKKKEKARSRGSKRNVALKLKDKEKMETRGHRAKGFFCQGKKEKKFTHVLNLVGLIKWKELMKGTIKVYGEGRTCGKA